MAQPLTVTPLPPTNNQYSFTVPNTSRGTPLSAQMFINDVGATSTNDAPIIIDMSSQIDSTLTTQTFTIKVGVVTGLKAGVPYSFVLLYGYKLVPLTPDRNTDQINFMIITYPQVLNDNALYNVIVPSNDAVGVKLPAYTPGSQNAGYGNVTSLTFFVTNVTKPSATATLISHQFIFNSTEINDSEPSISYYTGNFDPTATYSMSGLVGGDRHEFSLQIGNELGPNPNSIGYTYFIPTDLAVPPPQPTAFTLADDVNNSYPLNQGDITVNWEEPVYTPSDTKYNITFYSVVEYVNGVMGTTTTVPFGTNTLTIKGNASRVGKRYKYTVASTNVTGTGTSSPPSVEIVSYFAPAKPLIGISFQKTSGSFPIYNGNFDIVLGTATSLNSGLPLENPNTYEISMTPPVGGLPLLPVYATFIDGKYTISTGTFSDMVYGTTYTLNVVQLSISPNNPQITLRSDPTSKQVTAFKSPNVLNSVSVSPITTQGTPVTLATQPAIRVKYDQLTETDYNGTNSTTAFSNNVQYVVIVSGIVNQTVSHVQGQTSNEVVFQSPAGQNVSVSVRALITNTELNAPVYGNVNSSIGVAAASFCSAVTNVQIKDQGDTTMKLSFTEQTGLLLGGSIAGDVNNRVVIYNKGGTVPLSSILYPLGTMPTPIICDLEYGQYNVFIIAESVTSERSIDSVGTVTTTQLVLRANYATSGFTLLQKPFAPSEIDLFADATNKNVTANYDIPLGQPVGSISNFSLYTSPFTAPTSADGLTAFVTNAVDDEMIATQAYPALNSNTPSLLTNTVYNAVLWATVTSLQSLQSTTSITLTTPNMGTLQLTPSSTIPMAQLNSDPVSPGSVYLGNPIPAPQVLVKANNTSVKLTVTKTLAQYDLVVVVSNNDATVNNVPYIEFDSSQLAANGNTGMTILRDGAPYPGTQYSVTFDEDGNIVITLLTLVSDAYKLDVRHKQLIVFNGSPYYVYSPVFTASNVTLIAVPGQPTNGRITAVDTESVTLEWSAPVFKGGAGSNGNSELYYQIEFSNILTGASNTTVSQNTTTLKLTSANPAYNWFVLNQTYNYSISALYYEGGVNAVPQKIGISTTAFQGQARGGLAPIGPVCSFAVGPNSANGSNSVTISIEAQTPAQSVFTASLLVKLYNGALLVGQTAVENITQRNVVPFTNLANGTSYSCTISSVPTYSYAPSAPDVVLTPIVPFAKPKIDSSSFTGKVLSLSASLHGCQTPNNVVAIARDVGGNVQVIPLSGTPLSSIITNIPSAGTATTAPNQNIGVSITFEIVPVDVVVILVCPLGSDTFVLPLDGFFKDLV